MASSETSGIVCSEAILACLRLTSDDTNGSILSFDEFAEALRIGAGVCPNQRLVPIDDVKKWVTQRWEYADALPNNEAIIRLPST
jgi:hypothetical protein